MFPCLLETNNLDAVETRATPYTKRRKPASASFIRAVNLFNRLALWHAENIGAALYIGPKLTVLNPSAVSVDGLSLVHSIH